MQDFKKIIVSAIVVFIFTVSMSIAQENNASPGMNRGNHSFGDICLYGSPDILFNTPNTVQFGGGIKFRLFLAKRFSLDADMVFARDYVHGGPGVIGIPIWLLILTDHPIETDEDMTFKELGLIVLAGILSFEHIAYHAPVNQSMDISPYVSLLRFKYAAKHNDYSNPAVVDQQFCFATGIELNKYFGRFVLSPYLEYNIGYKDKISGVNTGIYLGYCFMHRY